MLTGPCDLTRMLSLPLLRPERSWKFENGGGKIVGSAVMELEHCQRTSRSSTIISHLMALGQSVRACAWRRKAEGHVRQSDEGTAGKERRRSDMNLIRPPAHGTARVVGLHL